MIEKELLKKELKHDLSKICACECCDAEVSTILYVPVIGNTVVVTHVCGMCFKDFELNDNVFIFNKD